MKNGEKIKLVLISADSKMGGGASHILGILRNIDKNRFETYLICPRGFLYNEARQINGIVAFKVEMKSKFDFAAVFEIKAILQKIQSSSNPFGPMIVHSHGPRAHLFSNFASNNQIKNFYTEHIFNENYHLSNPLNEWAQRTLLKYLNKKTDVVIAVSKSVKSYLVESKLVDQEKVIIIPNGIDISLMPKQVGKKIKEINLTPVIGTIGSLNKQKGHQYLIEAMPLILQKYPLATLEILGDGEEMDSLKLRAKNLKIKKHISFLGYQKDIYKYMKHWDVFVLSSVSETFGIALLEAMVGGIPVIATKTGGAIDIVSNNKNGLLVKVKDPKEISKAVVAIIDKPVLAAQLKREGMLRSKDFDWKQIVKKLENAYMDIAS